ncbi:uncharacterized protein LOC114734576 [Neltuma alba]|uniref:uncharacterized protein LOC114734576 n=1 Tax=Neltuma alba TaxID=207710 RepID=UPI0010A2FC64|nr:uncharacterized protein LOC114734576 [Prosopis alba]
MESQTSSLIPQIDRSKVLSTAMNNPITFILGQLHSPSKLLEVFTFPIPVSFPFRRSLISTAELLALVGLIVAGSVAGVTILWVLIIASSPIWLPAAVALSVLAVGLFAVCGFGAVVAVAMAWLLGRYFPSRTPRASAPETPLKKNKSTKG